MASHTEFDAVDDTELPRKQPKKLTMKDCLHVIAYVTILRHSNGEKIGSKLEISWLFTAIYRRSLGVKKNEETNLVKDDSLIFNWNLTDKW